MYYCENKQFFHYDVQLDNECAVVEKTLHERIIILFYCYHSKARYFSYDKK